MILDQRNSHVPGNRLPGTGSTLTPEQVGEKPVELSGDPGLDDLAYLLTPAGSNPTTPMGTLI